MAQVLPPATLHALLAHARALGLEALCEAHSAAEVDELLASGARVVGVNARDLATLQIDRAQQRERLACLPASVVRVAESGLDDAAGVRAAGAVADAVLIGSHLAAHADPAGAAVALGFPRRLEVKACGVRRIEDVDALEAAAARGESTPDFLGINVVPTSRRAVDAAQARALAARCRRLVPVLVVRDLDVESVARAATDAGVDWVQLHGSESPAEVRALADRFAVVKALGREALSNPAQLTAYAEAGAARLLVDGPVAGSGERWEAVWPALHDGCFAGTPVWLAGGLKAIDLPEVLATLAADGAAVAGVDAASDVELDGAFAPTRAQTFARVAREEDA
jgi:phosphoribosylanthranilate isomerase